MATISTIAPVGLAGADALRKSPFDLGDGDAYRRWREAKLDGYPESALALVVAVGDVARPTAGEVAALQAVAAKTNMAVYRGPPPSSEKNAAGAAEKAAVLAFAETLGLQRTDRALTTDDDAVTELAVATDARKQTYIPYSNKPLGWHTDGVYNPPVRTVGGFLLHCVRDAARGGDDLLLDPEIAYIQLRDADPEFIAGLSLPDAMTIPANIENGTEVRPRQTGPVFSVDPADGALNMRFSGRKRFVEWRDDPRVRGALEFLRGLLDGNGAQIFRVHLRPGEGLVCNNVLHAREGFVDGNGKSGRRLLYRIRFLDRIGGDCF